MNFSNFYTNMDFKYPEIAICIEDTNTKIGKFFIPILTPMLSSDTPYIEKTKGLSKRNIINKNNLIINPIYESNYIELPLPNNYNMANKGDKFIVIFLGGNPNKPILIGGYNNG